MQNPEVHILDKLSRPLCGAFNIKSYSHISWKNKLVASRNKIGVWTFISFDEAYHIYCNSCEKLLPFVILSELHI